MQSERPVPNSVLRTATRRLASVAPAIPGLLAVLWGAYRVWGGAKDDTWISFRYAKNLWDGFGPTFNPGEAPVEGYTNFLWTLALVPVVGAGGDPLVGAAILGAALTMGAVVAVVAGTRLLGASQSFAGLAGLVFAAWPDVLLWAVRGLEQGMVVFFGTLGLVVALRASDAAGSAPRARSTALAAAAGLLLAAACLTRPEGHALVVAVGAALLGSRWFRGTAAFALAVLGVLLPYHAWRQITFHSWVPNTYLVKGGGGFGRWRLGVAFVGDLLWTEQVWIVLALAVVALAVMPRHRRGAVATGLGILAIFLVYLVKVGTDEFPRYRLFLPAWPIAVALAVAGTSALPDPRLRRAAVAGWLLWVSNSLWSADSVLPAAAENGGIDGVRFGYANLGRYLTRHSRPGELVAFQDIGAAAFHAPDLNFLDTIGLVDRHISGLYEKYGYQPFARRTWRADPELRKKLAAFDAEGRAYLESRDPDWVVYVATLPNEDEEAVTRAWQDAPDQNPVDRWLVHRPYYYGWSKERSFRERYTFVRTWRRNGNFWVTLWRRNDHLAQVPAEVALDRVPQSLGPVVELVGGHRVLGGVVGPEVRTRDDVWVDVYLALGGRGEPGTLVDVALWHVDASGTRTKHAWVETHVPGDWLWPAERWVAGRILRDRVQIPLHRRLRPGTYEVTWQLRHRATGEIVGRADGTGTGAVPIGRFDIRARAWWELAFVRPTDPIEQRAGPVR